MPEPGPPGRTRSRRIWAQETDLLSALFRTAFLLAFVSAPLYLRDFVAQQALASLPVRLILSLASLFTLIVFVVYARRGPLHWQRPISLAVDVALVSAALYVFGPRSSVALFQVYYLVVLQGAIWFRITGALAAAVAATLGHGLAQAGLAGGVVGLDLLAGNTVGLPFLFIVAVVSGYLVASRDREHQEADRLRREMLLARTLQDLMLPPEPPQLPRWAVGLRLEPALEVGGDLYVLEPVAGGKWVVCLGDICGRSVRGMLYLSLIVAHTRAAAREGLSARDIARRVNAEVYDTLAPETYAALFLGLLDPVTGQLSFVNCGHPPPLVLGRDGPPRLLHTGGMVIGAARGVDYREDTTVIAPGEALVASTDGVVGARNWAGDEFGEERVAQVVRRGWSENLTPEAIVASLIAATQDWSAHPGADDATCLLLQRLDETEA